MTPARNFRRLLRLGSVLRRDARADMDEEIDTHLALRAEELRRRGLSEADALAEARRRFGANLGHARRRLASSAAHRDAQLRRRDLLGGLRQDLRFALRSLRRDPLLAFFVVVTLALGIGANAAMFGIADRLLLRGPEHVRDPGRVVRVYVTSEPPGMGRFTTSTVGHVTTDVLRQGTHSFSGIAEYTINSEGVMGRGAEARPVTAGYASASLFPLLGVQPALGRFFDAREDAPGAAERVVVLDHGAWQRWFGGRRDVLGETITLGDEPYTIVGVAPAGFTGPELAPVDLWAPINLRGPRVTEDWQTSWSVQWLHVVARLAPGVTPERAGLDATAAYRRAYTGDEAPMAQASLHVGPLSANDAGAEPPELRVLRWLVGVAAIVLLIACANVVNLLLARGIRRGREVAVRAALGASRARVARLLLLESVLLTLAGAAAGVAVAWGLGRLVRGTMFSGVAWPSSPVNGRVLLASAAVAAVTGVLVGLLPALRVSRASLGHVLKSGAREGGGRRSRLRDALTVAQAALSVVLLVGAGLFVRSLWNVRSLDLGIDPERVLVVDVTRPRLGAIPEGPAREAERARRQALGATAVERLRRVPGIAHASAAVGLPFGNRFTVRLRVPGLDSVPTLAGRLPGISAVGSDYFATVGTRIVRGRAFDAGDRAGSERVAIVSERMARTLWPNTSAIGRCLVIGADDAPCARIVGIAEDTHRSQLREDPSMHYYIPLGQEEGFGGTVLLVRPTGSVATAVADVRRELLALDPGISYVSGETLQARIAPQMKPWTLGATVFVLSGALALLVAAVGIYSVLSYLVAGRTHELGVRRALGARRGDITRLVLRSSLTMAVVGIAAGCGLALAGGPFVEPLLFDVSARDPLVYTGVAGVLLVVALAASLVPAMRANRVDPLEALRSE